MSVFPTGESGERGTTPPRDIKVRRITAVLLCQHTHTLSELSAQTFTVSDKFRHFSSAQQQGYIHCLVKWKKEGFVGEFPPRLRPSWFSFINMLICDLWSDEWWRVGRIDCTGISHFSVWNWPRFVSFESWSVTCSISCALEWKHVMSASFGEKIHV